MRVLCPQLEVDGVCTVAKQGMSFKQRLHAAREITLRNAQQYSSLSTRASPQGLPHKEVREPLLATGSPKKGIPDSWKLFPDLQQKTTVCGPAAVASQQLSKTRLLQLTNLNTSEVLAEPEGFKVYVGQYPGSRVGGSS